MVFPSKKDEWNGRAEEEAVAGRREGEIGFKVKMNWAAIAAATIACIDRGDLEIEKLVGAMVVVMMR